MSKCSHTLLWGSGSSVRSHVTSALRLLAADLVHRAPQNLQHPPLILHRGAEFFVNGSFQLVAQSAEFGFHLLPLAVGCAARAAAEMVRDVLVLGVLFSEVRQLAAKDRQLIPDVVRGDAVFAQILGALPGNGAELFS